MHTLTSNISPLNVFLNNTSAFEVYNDKISLYSGSIETSNFLVKYDSAGYEWTSNALPYVFDQNEFSNIGNNVFFKSLPYSKFGEKGSTTLSDIGFISEPVISGGTVFSSNIPSTTDKYLAFTYQPLLTTIYPTLNTDSTNLKVWYKFDDPTNLGKDEFNLRNLTTYSATSIQDLIGNSVYFNSDSQYLSIANFNLNFDNTVTTTGISFNLWFKLDSTSDHWGHLFCWGIAGSNQTHKFALLRNNTDQKLIFQLGAYLQTAVNISAYNTWTHIVVCIDTSRVLTMYENTIAIQTFTLTTSQYSSMTTNSAFTIGASLGSSGAYDYKGGIEDFRIYNKVLSSSEISTLYNISPYTSYTVNFPEQTLCDILMVAGGGGGGSSYSTTSTAPAGGGGAGGLIFLQNQTIPADNYTIKVGKGGDGDIFTDTTNQRGKNGYNSSFSYLQTEAIGGGGGGSRLGVTDTANGLGGGSGGGSTYSILSDGTSPQTIVGGSGTISDLIKYDGTVLISNYRQGFKGGDHIGNTTNPTNNAPYCGGGGGAGEEGYANYHAPDDTLDANGGNGIASQNDTDFKTHFNITDTNIGEHNSELVYFAGGGAGGFRNNLDNNSVGGLGGGADSFNGASLNGQPNTGGGGSGSRSGSLGQANGGNGGSGIVIIRYKTTKGSQYQGKSQGILKYIPTPSTTSTNTGTWAIEESANTTFKSDFIRTISKDASRTIAPVNGNTIETDFLFDPDTKFSTKSNNILTNYKYNINASLVTTNSSDKIKYLFAFVYYNKPTIGAEISQAQIIKSNLDADWTISNITKDNKRYVKITVKTVSAVDSINIKI